MTDLPFSRSLRTGAPSASARQELTEYLIVRPIAVLLRNSAFLETPAHMPVDSLGEPVAYQVRHIVPRLVMELRAGPCYEPILMPPVTTYHMLRIDCKRLRYATLSPLLGVSAPR